MMIDYIEYQLCIFDTPIDNPIILCIKVLRLLNNRRGYVRIVTS